VDEFLPRIFLNDSGLMASLMGLSAKNLHTAYGLNAALLETFLHVELQKHIGWAQACCEQTTQDELLILK
jgi:hypothetical protein